MTSTLEPEFYDAAMTDSHEPAMLPLEDSPWLSLYQAAAALINPWHPVVDLGAGTGRFAECLRRNGHQSAYTGLDFSPAAIAECKRYVPEFDSGTDWHGVFRVVDLRSWGPEDDRAASTTYVSLETLEHMEDDLDVVRRVPPGHEFIFSVPNYGGEAHLRVFENIGDAMTRYGNLLTFTDWKLIGEGPRYHIHLYRARRRVDSW